MHTWLFQLRSRIRLFRPLFSTHPSIALPDSSSCKLREILGIDSFVFNKLTRFGFFLVNLPKTAPSAETLIQELSELSGRQKLFITSEETPQLETQTLNLFNNTPQPKDMLRLKHSKTSVLYDVDRKNYENTIVEFFKKNLPVRGI